MTWVDSQAIADRLGVPQEAVRDVQRRGFLRHFDLEEAEIRRRLLYGHLIWRLRRGRGGVSEN